MRINPIVQYNQSNTKPTFKKADYFSHIKKIDGMTCAGCGKKVLHISNLVEARTSLAKPLKYIMQKGGIEFIQRSFPKTWDVLKNFAEKFPDKNLDQIIKDSENYTALKVSIVEAIPNADTVEKNSTEAVRVSNYISKIFFDMIDHSRAHMAPSAVVMKQMAPLKEFLNGTRKEVFEQFEIYSRKYPDKRLSEIIQLEEVYKFHNLKNILQIAATKEKVDYHFGNIELIVQEENPELLEKIKELKEQAIETYKTEKDESARTYKTKELYSNFLLENNCKNIIPRIMSEIEEIPTTFITVDSFFVGAYLHQYNDASIMSSLFNPVVASADYITAISDGGIDKLENKIVMCRECNSIRGNRSYDEFMKYHPDLPNHMQKQMDIICEGLLNNKELDFLRFYPIKTIKNITENSNGRIKLNIDEYCRISLEKSKKNYEKLQQELKEAISARISAKQKITTAKSGQSKLSKQISSLNQRIEELKDKIQEEANLISRIESYFKKRATT